MPSGKPAVGETWSLLLADSPTQSVVCSTDPPGIRLMSRLGRTIVLPNRTLELCGTFQHPALDQICQHPGSDEHPGYLQIQDPNGIPCLLKALRTADLSQPRIPATCEALRPSIT